MSEQIILDGLRPSDSKVRITERNSSVGVSDADSTLNIESTDLSRGSKLQLQGGFRAAMTYTERVGSNGSVCPDRDLGTMIKYAPIQVQTRPVDAAKARSAEDILAPVMMTYADLDIFDQFLGSQSLKLDSKAELTAQVLASYYCEMQEAGLKYSTDFLTRAVIEQPVVSIISAGESIEVHDARTWDLWARVPLNQRTTHVEITTKWVNDETIERSYHLTMDPLDRQAMEKNTSLTVPLSQKYWNTGSNVAE